MSDHIKICMVETDHFDDPEYNNPANLTALTRELDDLHQ